MSDFVRRNFGSWMRAKAQNLRMVKPDGTLGLVMSDYQNENNEA